MKSSFRIVEISFGRSHWDASYEFELAGRRFEVQRFGANFSVDAVKDLIKQFRTEVDAFALTSLPPVIHLGDQSFVHRQYLEVMNMPSSVPLCDGTGLREVSNMNALIKAIESKKIQPELGVFFPAAVLNADIEEYIRHRYKDSVYFGDAYAIAGLPFLLKPFPGLMTLAKMSLNIATMKDLRRNTPLAENSLQKMSRIVLASQVSHVQYVVGDLPFIILFDQGVEFIRGKDIVIWSHHPTMEEELKKYNPRSVINLFPEEFAVSPYMNYSVLEAALRLVHSKTAQLSFEEWAELLSAQTEVTQIAKKYALTRKTSTQVKISRSINKFKNKLTKDKAPDFAFVVHALSHRDFEKLPVVGPVIRHLPQSLNDPFDRLIAKAPPIVYGQINHIISEHNGREVNGIIYGLTSTPKVLKNEDPEVVYSKIQRICYDAASRGAKIIGLGAYTKVVGDSGVTINQNSPIPVTTGNSLSASATLWGLYDVVSKMRLLDLDKNSGHVNGTAMVVGATGSIGKVSSKLLALAFKKLVLIAPRRERLEELAQELRKMAPHCEVTVGTDANHFAPQADVVVTATSAFDQKIVDVKRLKPGCVVCDCSRPLDFSKEDAKQRPDVLIMESGELILPGPYDLTCNIGLPGKAVYACLAETACLAMEERYETFTMGRDIDWVKVKEIYKISKKHGVKLAAIQGHVGIITDREIQLTRELAISRLKQLRTSE